MAPINRKGLITLSTEANISTEDYSFDNDYQYLYHWMLFGARYNHYPDPSHSNCSDSDLQNDDSIINLGAHQGNRIKKNIKENSKTQTFKHKKSKLDKKLIKRIALFLTQTFPNIVNMGMVMKQTHQVVELEEPTRMVKKVPKRHPRYNKKMVEADNQKTNKKTTKPSPPMLSELCGNMCVTKKTRVQRVVKKQKKADGDVPEECAKNIHPNANDCKSEKIRAKRNKGERRFVNDNNKINPAINQKTIKKTTQPDPPMLGELCEDNKVIIKCTKRKAIIKNTCKAKKARIQQDTTNNDIPKGCNAGTQKAGRPPDGCNEVFNNENYDQRRCTRAMTKEKSIKLNEIASKGVSKTVPQRKR